MESQVSGSSKKLHYKNKDFGENLVAASGGGLLADIAPQWSFSHFGAEERGSRHCQLCHSHIQLWVAIHHAKNGMMLFVGHDCYDKFVDFLVTNQVESRTIITRKQQIALIKQYCRTHISESFLKWFTTQDIPGELRNVLNFIEWFGYAPTRESAEALVAFYKMNRRFRLAELVDFGSHRGSILRSLFGSLPKDVNPLEHEITLAQYEKIDFGFVNHLNQEDLNDSFFKEALRKTFPEYLTVEHFSDHLTFGRWIECAEKFKLALIDEAWKRAIINLETHIAQSQENYLLHRFWAVQNPKTKRSEWVTWDNGIQYILERESTYHASEGPVFTGVTRWLVPDKVALVAKLSIVQSKSSPQYAWITPRD